MTAPCRVLVVDDESSLALTITANLELEGFEVVECRDGRQALDVIRARPFDLVLSDIRMPGMNGVELFREIRRLHPAMPVILMTAFALEGLVDQALREGAFAVLSKPFSIEHLIAVLSAAARRPAVLVVDDLRPVAESTAAALCAVGIRATAATDGPTAFAMVRAGGVDVCVVDMVMPGMDGAETIEAVHRHDPHILCIAISGHDAQELFRRAAAHVQTIMKKPIDPGDLAIAVARARGKVRTA